MSQRYTIVGDGDGHQWLCPVERYREVQAAIDALEAHDWCSDGDPPPDLTGDLQQVQGELLTFTDPRIE